MNHSHAHNIKKPSTPLKNFIPLISIFAVIILFTAFMLWRLGQWDLFFALRNFMGAFFLVFGGFKVINLKGFANAYGEYDILAKRSRIYAYVYPFIELALGVAYLLSFQLFITNWVTLVVMLASSVGVAKELAKKSEIPCACLGVVFKIPMTKVTLTEDLLMAVMALWMIMLLA